MASARVCVLNDHAKRQRVKGNCISFRRSLLLTFRWGLRRTFDFNIPELAAPIDESGRNGTEYEEVIGIRYEAVHSFMPHNYESCYKAWAVASMMRDIRRDAKIPSAICHHNSVPSLTRRRTPAFTHDDA